MITNILLWFLVTDCDSGDKPSDLKSEYVTSVSVTIVIRWITLTFLVHRVMFLQREKDVLLFYCTLLNGRLNNFVVIPVKLTFWNGSKFLLSDGCQIVHENVCVISIDPFVNFLV